MTTAIRLHQSIAAEIMNRSPLHGWHKAFKKEPEAYDARTTLGQIAHSMILGGKDIVAIDAKDWRTSAAKEARDAAILAGKLPILKERLIEVRKLVDDVNGFMVEHGIESGIDETTIQWETPSGIPCEGRLDRWIPKRNLIIDFKFCESAHKKVCESKFIQFGYDIQSAAYTQGVEFINPQLAGRIDMWFVFIEVDPPNAMRIMPLAGSMKTCGQWRWGQACDIWAACLEKYGPDKPWPSYSDSNEPAECPPWFMNQQMIQEEMIQAGVINDYADI